MARLAGSLSLLVIAAFVSLAAGQARAAVMVSASPSQASFGEQAVGMEYLEKDLYLEGTSATGVTMESAVVTGTDADDFPLDSSSCVDVPLDDSTACFLLVSFEPDAVGESEATIEVEFDQGDPLLIPLTGKGVDPAPNAPDLAAPILNESPQQNDLWGYAGGDFQGQGRAGVAFVSQMDDHSVAAGFAFGQEDGTVTAPIWRQISVGGFAGSIAAGDLNGDGELDAVGAGGGTAKAFLNLGEGDMDSGTELPVGEDGIEGNLVVGEFTGDSDLDVLAGYNTYDEGPPESFYMLEVFPGEGDGTFGAPISQLAQIDGPMGMATGNFDGDEVDDFAVTDWAGNVIMFSGDGDGTFTEIGRFGPGCGCQSPWGVTTADLNGDGLDDVIATMRFEDELAIFLSQPGGTFVRGQRPGIPLFDGWTPNPYAVSAGDLNGDAFPDLLVGNYLNDTGSVLVGNGDGTVSFAQTLLTSDEQSISPHGTYVGDFNGDGRPDASIAGQDGTIATYMNEGEPGLSVAPSSVDFGNVTSGTASAPIPVTVTNAGGLAALEVSALSIAGGQSGEFEIVGQDCDVAVPAGRSCEVEVTFAPAGAAGARSSSLVIDTNHPSDPQVVVPLTGVAKDPPPPSPGIGIDPLSHDFGQIRVGRESGLTNFAVTSTGSLPLKITSVTVTGGGASGFVPVSNDCVGSHPSGSGCALGVRFKPSRAGAWTAEIRLATNVAGGPETISLSGTGVAAPVVRRPKVIIKKRPKAKIRIRAKKLRKVRVAFRSDQRGAKFRCRIDRRGFHKCRSPKAFRNIRPGRHAIRIRATKNGRVGPVKVIKFRVIRLR